MTKITTYECEGCRATFDGEFGLCRMDLTAHNCTGCDGAQGPHGVLVMHRNMEHCCGQCTKKIDDALAELGIPSKMPMA